MLNRNTTAVRNRRRQGDDRAKAGDMLMANLAVGPARRDKADLESMARLAEARKFSFTSHR